MENKTMELYNIKSFDKCLSKKSSDILKNIVVIRESNTGDEMYFEGDVIETTLYDIFKTIYSQSLECAKQGDGFMYDEHLNSTNSVLVMIDRSTGAVVHFRGISINDRYSDLQHIVYVEGDIDDGDYFVDITATDSDKLNSIFCNELCSIFENMFDHENDAMCLFERKRVLNSRLRTLSELIINKFGFDYIKNHDLDNIIEDTDELIIRVMQYIYSPDISDTITVKLASELSGLSDKKIRELINKEVLEAEKDNGIWKIDTVDFADKVLINREELDDILL